ncbi:putative ABC exporter domain-containing protein [Longimicrobium sp.]|uniref:putative ABC exporter domain-containing protein n=1 Tax=Longimicrobium sp. TaxID=2029185 RepID=UPI002F927632
MNPGLRYLARAGFRGVLRRTGRRMRTARGFLTTVLGALLMIALVGSQVVALVLDESPTSAGDAAAGFTLVLMALVGWAVVNSEAPFFWPAEVQHLFAAPISRRELLGYQLASRAWLQLLSGLWVGTIGMRSAPWPLAALSTAILGITFVNVAGLLAALVKMAVVQRAPAAVKAIKPAFFVSAAVLAAVLYARARAVGLGDAMGEVLASAPLRALSLPLQPFGRAFAAEGLVPLVLWSAASAAVIAVTFGAAVLLPVDFREASLSLSARKVAQWQRVRGRGGPPTRRRIPVPSFGFLGTAAPLARRHGYELGRAPRPLLGLAFSAGLAFFYSIVLPWTSDYASTPRPLGVALVVMVAVFAVLGSGSLNLDFRRDAERIAFLRSLPLRPRAVAVAQVFTPAAILTLASLLLLVGTALSVRWHVRPMMLLLAMLLAGPISWICVGLENWLFLLFPTRVTPAGTEQNSFSGRLFLKTLTKLMLLFVVVGLALLAAVPGRMVAGRAGGVSASVLVVLAACWAATWLVARAFRGFDLAVDNPD